MASAQPRTIGGCPIFPANNVWNTPVDTLPVSANSAAYVATIGASSNLFPDFWSDAGGVFLNIVPAGTPRVPVTVMYATEADPGPYPIPANALVQQASDAHVLIIDQGNCKYYEMWSAAPQPDGSWSVGSAATFDLRSNVNRPSTWTSADAAGTPMLAGVVTYDEVMSGAIHHAIGITVPQTQSSFIWPATHQASYLTGSQYPPMGQRFRLKAGFDVSPYPFEVQVILNALKKYGAIVYDNGAPWFMVGVQDPRWNDNNLHTITQVLGSNMEAVDDSSLMVARNSSVVAGSPLALDSIFLDHRQVSPGTAVTGQAILTAPAPAGGVTVSLSSSNPAAASVPGSVFVPAGAAFVNFSVTVNSVALTTPVFLTGAWNGVAQTSPELWVTGNTGQAAPLLSAFALSSSTVLGGTSLSATVTLTSAAPAGGTVVALSTLNSAMVQVPATVTVPAGATTANVPVSTVAQSANATVYLSATLNAESLWAPVTLTNTQVVQPQTIRINAGGPAYTDPSGNAWSADASFSGGATWSTSANIANTNTPSLYQTCRYGTFIYQVTIPNGNYTVNLKFAEPSRNGAGLRQFNVAINGAGVLRNFDIFAQAGFLTAIDKAFPVTVLNNQIQIVFTQGASDLPLVSAIEILPATASTASFTPIRVNAGGAAYKDPGGTQWSADTGYSGGNSWSTSSTVSRTGQPGLYQTCRWGVFGYNFAVPNANYTVTLKFAEISLSGAGQRQFNVAINGAPVLANFDVFAQAGFLNAIDASFPITVVNGQINIQFTQGNANFPLVNGIDIESR